MSSVTGPAPVGNTLSSVMISVRAPGKDTGITSAQLESTLQRIAMRLYIRAHCEAPPSATDFGGGVYNILV
jgi:hypothetical protein